METFNAIESLVFLVNQFAPTQHIVHEIFLELYMSNDSPIHLDLISELGLQNSARKINPNKGIYSVLWGSLQLNKWCMNFPCICIQ